MADTKTMQDFKMFLRHVPFLNHININYVKRFFFEMNAPRFVEEHRRLDPKDLDGLLDFAMVRWLAYVAPGQVRWEIRSLLELLMEKNVKRFMEIGTGHGGTLFLCCKAFGKGSVGISVDMPGSNFGGGYPHYKERIFQTFAAKGQKLHLLREDSHAQSTLEKARELLGGEKLDFLFIDGDHTYEGVKKDFEMYSGLVKKGGAIAFHDIAPHAPETGCEVDRYWNELKRGNRHREFIENKKQGWGGIGVIFK